MEKWKWIVLINFNILTQNINTLMIAKAIKVIVASLLPKHDFTHDKYSENSVDAFSISQKSIQSPMTL